MSAPGSNFCYPVRVLENDRVKLVPFDPDLHQETLFNATKPNSQRLYKYLPFGPFASVDEANKWYKARFEPNDGEFLYAVLVKTRDGGEEMSGTIGLLFSEPVHASTEIGFVMTIPKFQHTHVTKNAIGLLLMYTLDPPPQGLGLRRVQWQAHGSNEASIGAAKRMGFFLEGFIRWQRKLPFGKESSADVAALAAQSGNDEPPGRHSAMLSMCWDDWLVKREEVVKLMDR